MSRPPLRTSDVAIIAIIAISLALWFGFPWPVFGQTVIPSSPVVNQGSEFRLLTKSDSATIPITRALFIGDATACDVSVVGSRDSAAVILHNVQSGAFLPIQIKQLTSANTTCTSVVALY